jgi:hypothetical protein
MRQATTNLTDRQTVSHNHYAKVIRNSLRHNKKLDLKEHGEPRDVIWGSRKIPAAAHGTPLTFDYFGPGDWFALHTAILKFALSLSEKNR